MNHFFAVGELSFEIAWWTCHKTTSFLFLFLNLHAVLEQSNAQKVLNNDVRSNADILKSKLLFSTLFRLVF